jgi:Tfp pilus assembly protein PilF
VPTTAGKGATAVAQATAADADRAAALIQSGNNQQALLLLDGIIAQSPRDARAYYLRAKASTNLLYAMDAHQQLQPSAYQCLADINQAILLEPTSGEYRVLRYQIKELLALNARLRVEQDYWYGQAIDDLRQATALHSSLTNSSGLTAIFLASAGHCQEAVDQANRLVAAAGFDVNPYLHFTLSVAYFCRGDMATALKYLDASLPFEKSEQLLWQRTITLYSLGRLEEARTQFDEMVAEYPGCYCRHALRTLIDIKLGERQTALDDLGVALSYGGPTPWAAGLYDYVQGLMALNYQGDRQAAASALQKAELELTFEEGPVILGEIRDLMTQLGVTPLTPTLSVPPTPTPQL